MYNELLVVLWLFYWIVGGIRTQKKTYGLKWTANLYDPIIRKDNEDDSEEEINLDSSKVEKDLIYTAWLWFWPKTWWKFIEDSHDIDELDKIEV